MMSNKDISPLFTKVKPRFGQILNNFLNTTNFNDVKDLRNVNGQNLISYIKKPENIKAMNENFNSKTDNDKALMLFTIKFNHMYKYISAPDGNPENGQFLSEALLKDINIVWDNVDIKTYTDFQSSTFGKKLAKNFEQIKENFFSYLEGIYKNPNSDEKT